jgi:hypothetical protein
MAAQNIKLNPFFASGKLSIEGLDFLIGEISSPPANIEDLAEIVFDYAKGMVYTEYQYAPLDQFDLMTNIAATFNAISANSWCDLCCSNTIVTYDKLKCKLLATGQLNPQEQFILNVILGMPCDPNMPPADARIGVQQLETTVLTDSESNELDKSQLLAFLAVAKKTAEYWWNEVNNGSSAWNVYFSGTTEENFRQFWMATIMGSVSAWLLVRSTGIPLSGNSSIAYFPIIGAITGVSAYAVYK